MKAVLLTAFGGPENLVLREVPEPVAGPGEVLVRVRACALNHLDLWVRAGLPAAKVKLPHILGSDVAGEVAALGPGVSEHKVGDRVRGPSGRSCGSCADCLDGREPDCPQYGIIGAYGGLTGATASSSRCPRNISCACRTRT